jgi:dTDP-4-amino-4,6-dideoxygalactose transaminase
MIPFLDLKAQHAAIRGELNAAIDRVFESSQFVLGREVEQFEREFAAYCGVRHAAGVNTGTSALHLAMLAAGIGAGDEVITVPFTFVATVAAVRYTGATPVLIDVDPQSLTMDVDQIERAITARTKAILPVHLYGQMANMDRIMAIARRHGLLVIEDACQAHGAELRGRRAGSIGDLGCFSFYPGKNLGACGEGGMVVTANEEYARRVRMLRDWGQSRKYCHELLGFNFRLEGMQGALLRVKLRHLDDWTEARRVRAARYAGALEGADVITPIESPETRHVYHVYAIRTSDRPALQQALERDGIQTNIHYPIPVHLQPAHADLGYKPDDFPVSEQAAREVLSLPMYPELPLEWLDRVADAVRFHSSSAEAEPASPKLAHALTRADAEPASPKLAREIMRAEAGA